jgi:hypothetical protein
MNDFKISIIVAGSKKFFEYTTIAIHSLLINGNVNPEDIIVTTTNYFYENWLEFKLYKKLGINVNVISHEYEGWFSKILALNSIFKKFPNNVTILQYDADIILNTKINISDMISDYKQCDCANYICQYADPIGEYFSREVIYIDGYAIRNTSKTNNFSGKSRYESFLFLNYGVTQKQFIDYLASVKWLHGGITIYNQSILQNIWPLILKHGWISHCDETAISLIKMTRSDFKWLEIDVNKYPHIVANNIGGRLSDTEHKGFIHYAGGYRDIECNSIYLTEKYKESFEFLKNYGI